MMINLIMMIIGTTTNGITTGTIMTKSQTTTIRMTHGIGTTQASLGMIVTTTTKDNNT